MRINKIIFIIIISVILIMSCKKQAIKYDYDIYVTGYYKNEKDISIACYWQNNKKVDLCDDTTESESKSIVIQGSDIFCAGYYKSNDGIKTACYWKNGNRINVGDGKNESYINSMLINDNDLYFAGKINEGFRKNYACYWKNNQLFKITEPKENAESFKIKMYHNKLYILATETNGKYHIPIICIDGYKQYLDFSETGGGGFPYDITFEKDDIYICGSVGNFNACFWKNGKLELLNSFTASAISLQIYKKKLFIAGSYLFDSNSKACYWINKKIYKLENEKDSGTYSDAWSESNNIFVLDDNIILTGRHRVEVGDVICYWINGKLYDMTDGNYFCNNEDSIVYKKESKNR
jgi:hypothetical protein